MKFLANFVHVIDTISVWAGKTASWVTLLLMASVCYEVIARYAFNSPTEWALEMGTFLFAAIWLFSGGFTHVSDAHVKVDIFYNRLSRRGKAIISTITAPFVIFFCVILIYELIIQGKLSFALKEHSSSTWGPPVYWLKMALPFGAFMFSLAALGGIFKHGTMAITGKELSSWK
jgi:TRAP-type mannitol/chloroaromatic compound transport system permease small subunit